MSRESIATSTIAGTIAFRNTDQANRFLLMAGYGPSRGPEEVAYKLNNYIALHGQDALNALAEIHPDRDVILPAQKENIPSPQVQNMNMSGGDGNNNGGYSNCNGNRACHCHKNDSSQMHFNASGDNMPALKSTNLLDQKSIMMIGLFCITAITIVALTRKGV